ncbi:hypothetical protein [Streptomyces sp. HUAS TT20]|uniref:hypothetical protein n=1 Tax=Streptomyces sp. HUAS TT20 TaxID=3447509 RepID=UPI0021DABF54|nr:hypothetical protein [Streptomyces sp. HUAS 15-9]UXY29458.1 hypothetical protein N8I87_24785 [Streptomyces sp. HUAS 15-9]
MTQTDLFIIDLFLLLYVVMLARSREIKWYQVTLISLFGFLLAGTPFSYPAWFMVQFIGKFFFG